MKYCKFINAWTLKFECSLDDIEWKSERIEKTKRILFAMAIVGMFDSLLAHHDKNVENQLLMYCLRGTFNLVDFLIVLILFFWKP